MDLQKLTDKQVKQLATQEADLFSEYVSVRANTSAASAAGAQVLEQKVKIDSKLFGPNSSHVRNDYKAMDCDLTEAGVANWTSDSAVTTNKFITPLKKQAAIAHEKAGETTTLPQDKPISVEPAFLKTYVDLFDKYAQARGDKDLDTCASILTEKLKLDDKVFGSRSINVIQDFEAIGRDHEEAGNHNQAGLAYFMANVIYEKKNDTIFATLAGLHAAENFSKARKYDLAIPLFKSGLTFYENIEQKMDKPGAVKQSSPYIRADLGHCYLQKREFDLAEKELTKSLADSQVGMGGIIPQRSIEMLKDLITVKTLQNKPNEAAQYAKLLQETEKRYQH